MMLDEDRVAAYDALVAAIYHSIDHESPWVEPLEMLRGMLKAPKWHVPAK